MRTIISKIVGITFCNSARYLNQLKIGDELQMFREPENPKDKNAIRIEDMKGRRLGYVSADLAADLAGKIDSGTKYICGVKEITGMSFNCLGCNIIIHEVIKDGQ